MPRLRDGVIKRGASWSYVIRVRDPATGVSKPRWVGGFETEEDATTPLDLVDDADSRFGSYRKLTASGEFRFVREEKKHV